MTLTPAQADRRTIYVGQVLEIANEFRREGEPDDPTLITVRTKAPSGTTSVITKAGMTNPAVGEWVATMTVDEPGSWSFRTEAAGVVDAVTEVAITVAPSAF